MKSVCLRLTHLNRLLWRSIFNCRFKDRGSACVEPPVVLPRNLTLPARQMTMKHHSGVLKQHHNVQEMQQSSLDDSKLFDSTTFGGPAARNHVKIIEPSGELDSLYPGMKIKSNYNGDTTIMDHSGTVSPGITAISDAISLVDAWLVGWLGWVGYCYLWSYCEKECQWYAWHLSSLWWLWGGYGYISWPYLAAIGVLKTQRNGMNTSSRGGNSRFWNGGF